MDKLREFIQESKEETSLIEKKSENIFVRFFKKLKSFFIIRLDKDNSNDNKNLEMVIFDLDGTLWSVDETTEVSVNEYLRNNNIDINVPIEVVRKSMGCTFAETAEIYFPNLEKSERERLLDEALAYNNQKILEMGGNVYSNVEKTLMKLKEKYKLTIVSNCGAGYIEAFLEYSKFDKFFSDFIAASKEKMSKADAIKTIIERNNVTKAIYVGDTDKDKAAAEGADVEFIQALYGFGNDLNSKYSIDEFESLPEMLNDISV